MADSPKSSIRSASGPRAVDADQSRDKTRTSGRRHHRESGDRGEKRSQQEIPSHRSSKKGSPRLKQVSTPSIDSSIARPSFVLDVIGQPERGVALGMPVETAVMISLKLPGTEWDIDRESIDTSRLFAVVSLLSESRSGEKVPLENGIMTGQKMFDSVHSMPEECAERLASNLPCRLVLGYFSFPGLLIRQSGTYCIRTTLFKMSSSGTGGGSAILTVDSDAVKVERRGGPAPRRQRAYS